MFFTGGKFTIYQPIILYRKFSADQIFNRDKFLQNHVLITDRKGIIVDLIKKEDAGDGIERSEGILCPGFINAHCHLELSHMKGVIPKHTGLVDFVLKVVNERHFEEEEILEAIEQAENEMLQNGIVAVGDICNNAFCIHQKNEGRMHYYNFIETSGFPPAVAEQRFKRATDIYNTYAASLPFNSFVPHAPYSVSTEMFRMINDYLGNNLISIHNQETAAENEFFEKGTGDILSLYEKMGIDISFYTPPGKSSFQTWLPQFTNGQSVISVHNVCTTKKDIEFAKLQTSNLKLQIFFCLCPNANLYISNSLPDIEMLIQQDCDIVLGTDSLASNDQLSILEEMRTIQKHFRDIDLATLLKWATMNGARALQMDKTLGSFEKGKQPGVLLIEKADVSVISENTSLKRIL